MRVIGTDKLDRFSRKHANAREALIAWLDEIERSDWKKPQDIKNRYRSADFLSGNRVIFNVKGNQFRLVIKLRYENGIVLIEWIGTHAEYSKKSF